MNGTSTYGIVARFEDAGRLVDAARALRAHHYRYFEGYSPYPVEELDHIVEGGNMLPAIVLAGGVLGAITAWWMQTYIAVIDDPINIGGRPLYSWPSFVVILFELTVLFASLSAFFGMLALSGFPRPNHPLFGVPGFTSVTRDGFFLCVEAADPLFHPERTSSLLKQFDPIEVREVETD